MRVSARLSTLLLVTAAAAVVDVNIADGMPGSGEVLGAEAHRSTSDCQTKIADLRTATQTAPITGKNAEKDRAGLVGKLDNAAADLAAGKNSDAIQKLDDFIRKVAQLRDAAKIAIGDAGSLVAAANDAILCIEALG
jgi:hypothetical protein